MWKLKEPTENERKFTLNLDLLFGNFNQVRMEDSEDILLFFDEKMLNDGVNNLKYSSCKLFLLKHALIGDVRT